MESLVKASRLQSQGKMAAAAAVRAAIPAGTEPKERSINKAAQALESVLFQFGGLSTVTRVLEKLMSRAPIAALLPDHLKATTVKIQAAMAEAVRDFLRVLTPHRGRRTDVNVNAFWSVVAAVLPQDLLKDRQGRSFMRMLHVNYRVVNKGLAHGRTSEAQGGWQLVVTSPHRDRIDWSPLKRWWHTEGSTEDNDHKDRVRVFLGKDGNDVDDDGTVPYDTHMRRYPNDSRRRLRQQFLSSADYGAMKGLHLQQAMASRRRKAVALVKAEASRAGEDAPLNVDNGAVEAEVDRLTVEYKEKIATSRVWRALGKKGSIATPTRAQIEDELSRVPNYPVLVVSKKQFAAACCKCIKRREGTECDCKLCSWNKYNIPRWHKARLLWRSTPASSKATCVDPAFSCRDPAWQAASKSAHDMMNFQLCRYLPHEKVNGPLPPAAGVAEGAGGAAEHVGLGVVVESESEHEEVVDVVESDDNEEDEEDDEDGLVTVRAEEDPAAQDAALLVPDADGGPVDGGDADVGAGIVGAESAADRLARLLDLDAAAAANATAEAIAADDEDLRRFTESPRWLTLRDADRPFRCRGRGCLNGTCRRWSHVEQRFVLKCGWGARRAPRCAIEYSEQDEFSWMQWELKLPASLVQRAIPCTRTSGFRTRARGRAL